MVDTRHEAGRSIGRRGAGGPGVNPITRLRVELGLSLRAVADALRREGQRTHFSVVADWEADLYLPSRPRLRVLARLFGVPASRLEDELLDRRRALGGSHVAP